MQSIGKKYGAKMQIGARMSLNVARLRNEKVFAIGFNKSGTSSMHALFRHLGRPSYHGIAWRRCADMGLLRQYDCFSDGPPEDLPKLYALFPDARYILNVRELESWILSRLAHIQRDIDAGRHNPEKDWDMTTEAVEQWIRQRNDYHMQVLDHFAGQADELLIVNFIRDELAATRICNFLGHTGAYRRPRHHVNPSKTVPARYREMIDRCAENLGLTDDDMRNDLLCGSLLDAKQSGDYPLDTSELRDSTRP